MRLGGCRYVGMRDSLVPYSVLSLAACVGTKNLLVQRALVNVDIVQDTNNETQSTILKRPTNQQKGRLLLHRCLAGREKDLVTRWI